MLKCFLYNSHTLSYANQFIGKQIRISIWPGNMEAGIKLPTFQLAHDLLYLLSYSHSNRVQGHLIQGFFFFVFETDFLVL